MDIRKDFATIRCKKICFQYTTYTRRKGISHKAYQSYFEPAERNATRTYIVFDFKSLIETINLRRGISRPYSLWMLCKNLCFLVGRPRLWLKKFVCIILLHSVSRLYQNNKIRLHSIPITHTRARACAFNSYSYNMLIIIIIICYVNKIDIYALDMIICMCVVINCKSVDDTRPRRTQQSPEGDPWCTISCLRIMPSDLSVWYIPQIQYKHIMCLTRSRVGRNGVFAELRGCVEINTRLASIYFYFFFLPIY